MESTWESREQQVLEAAVRWFDSPDVHRMEIPDIVARTGLDEDDVKRALRALDGASPPYIVGVSVAEFMYPVVLTSVTERARRAVGQWPSPESMLNRMLTILRERAENAPQDERPRWRRLRDGFAGAGRDVAVEFAAALLARGAGA